MPDEQTPYTIITTLFSTGSKELTQYLAKYQPGRVIVSPDGKITWKIESVNTDDTVPPNPETGGLVTRVDLAVTQNASGT